MTEDTERFSDWLATTAQAYGYGYTRRQAFLALASNHDPGDDPVTVDLIEHHGEAFTGPMGWEVEEFVDGERIEVDPDTMRDLRDAAIDLGTRADAALDRATPVEDFETVEE